ncbi:MAG TPA: hypothetical protein VHX38_02625 [Pseudonocardiaceae bacterium]|jgi:hypothetical protein|nr:hypothetical protein [Pseudonocardiaceae bacterium]
MGGKPSRGTGADKRLTANRSGGKSSGSAKKTTAAKGKSPAPTGKSGLSAKTNRRRNTKTGRAQMGGNDFGLPGAKKYRIDDAAHARNALVRVAQNGTPAQKKQVQGRVAARYPGIAVTRTTRGKKK